MKYGTLWIVPTPLDHGYPEHERQPLIRLMPQGTIEQAARIKHWITENAKSTRGFLKRVQETHSLPCSMQEMRMTELPRDVHKKGDHETQDLSAAKDWLTPALAGHDMGLISEAGMPAIADPGSSVVRAAHALDIHVRALDGPVSLMLALASSGLNGQSFAFHGYLKIGDERAAQVRQLENLAWQSGQTQIVIETPYRNAGLLDLLLRTLKPQTRLAVATGLTIIDQVPSARVSEWRQKPMPALDGPSVFLWGPN
jgi:16S rRNA (cytidine1402-2'-O)-methyltransferase